jgi:hypothetical protein
MNDFNQRNLLSLVGTFVIGFLIGLVIFGWNLTPTRNFTNAGPRHLSADRLDMYVVGLATWYAASGDIDLVGRHLCLPDGGHLEAVRKREAAVTDGNLKNQYLLLLNGIDQAGGCGVPATGAAGTGAGSLLGTLLSLLFLGVLGVGLWWMWQRRQPESAGRTPRQPASEPLLDDWDEGYEPYSEDPRYERDTVPPAPAATPTTPRMTNPLRQGDQEPVRQLAGFQAVYQHGTEEFDRAFIIENANGDFLGECRIGIAETIGSGSEKQVVAFELWLFDRNDERTFTRIIMSEDAYYDEALRAKLATRGEPVLADPGAPIALETASLIINAEVMEVDYLPGDSDRLVFDRFGIDLQAWVKAEQGRKASRPGDALDFA